MPALLPFPIAQPLPSSSTHQYQSSEAVHTQTIRTRWTPGCNPVESDRIVPRLTVISAQCSIPAIRDENSASKIFDDPGTESSTNLLRLIGNLDTTPPPCLSLQRDAGQSKLAFLTPSLICSTRPPQCDPEYLQLHSVLRYPVPHLQLQRQSPLSLSFLRMGNSQNTRIENHLPPGTLVSS